MTIIELAACLEYFLDLSCSSSSTLNLRSYAKNSIIINMKSQLPSD